MDDVSFTDAPPRPGVHPYLLADVFTHTPFGGNPLAIFPHGGKVPPESMAPIARELNLSETVFILPPEDPAHAARLRIFTPGRELPFAGHPTVGAACALALLERVPMREGAAHPELTHSEPAHSEPAHSEPAHSERDTDRADALEWAEFTLEEGAGPVPVRVTRRRDGTGYVARLETPRLPESGPSPPPPATLARILSLSPDELEGGSWSAEGVSCGVPFLIIPVRGTGALARIRVDLAEWRETLASWWAPHLYVIAREPGGTEGAGAGHIRARMFAPDLGVGEDPATGAAAAALAGYLAAREASGSGTFRWRIHQGVEMGRPGVMETEVELEGDRIVRVRVGGGSVFYGEGRLFLGGT
jgi:trans-2,3-dihydro-3-hydroxyanthranilate isomerase